MKEVQKANIHNGTEEQEDESPEVEGEIKEEGGLKVEFFSAIFSSSKVIFLAFSDLMFSISSSEELFCPFSDPTRILRNIEKM